MFLAIAGATLLTYVYDRDATLWERLCSGVCTGFAALGLIGFILASLMGMTPVALGLSAGVTALPLLLLLGPQWRTRVAADIRETKFQPSTVVFYLVAALVFWFVSSHAMYENEMGIFTGFDTNIGDLPFHLAIINGFAYGENFPPQHPEFAGVAMTYPYLVDFVTAMFVRAGASLQSALFWQTWTTLIALAGLLNRWALQLTRDRMAAMIATILVFFSGGFGWITFLREAAQGEGMFRLAGHLPHDYTVGEMGYRWGNAITALFIPQRGMLLGVALAVLVWTLWPSDDNEDSGRKMIAAGIVAGMLPLVHAHSFIVTMGVGGCLALLKARTKTAGKCWLAFFATAGIVAMPQILWAMRGSVVDPGNFLTWEMGWDHGTENPVSFWIKNTAVFIPLLIGALLTIRRPALLYFYLPFSLCFVLPNVFRLSPWIWDNIKILFFWWIASAPLVAMMLVALWRDAHRSWRMVALVLFLAQTAAGSLDVWRGASGSVERRTFDPAGLRFAELIRQSTPPRSLILHAPTYNDPVYLTGRRTFMGYAGHLWSHGLNYAEREDELKRIYTGAGDAEGLLAKNGIDYIVVGPLEEAEMRNYGLQLNRNFFERYPKVAEEGNYRLYRTART